MLYLEATGKADGTPMIIRLGHKRIEPDASEKEMEDFGMYINEANVMLT